MHKLMIALVMVAAATGFAAELTEAERAARAEKLYKRTGGFIIRREANSGFFAVVNAQTNVSAEAWRNELKEIRGIFRVDINEMPYKECVTAATAVKALKALKANAALFIVWDESSANTILLAPEGRWGILNLAALKNGNPPKEVFEQRVRREFWRGFSMVAGSPSTEMEHCLLNPILSLSQLDDFQGNTIGPEPLTRIEKTLRAMGIKQYERSSYKNACRNGWAPAPTNDVQKAIWEQVKAEKAAKAAKK